MPRDFSLSNMVTESIRHRILNGDYLKTGFPSLRQLTRELGSSLTTVRTAVQILKEEGLLVQADNMNKVILNPELASSDSQLYRVLFLTSIEGSLPNYVWGKAIMEACREMNLPVSLRSYQGPRDTEILASLQDIHNLIFFVPPSGLSQGHLSLMRSHSNKIVTLFHDYRSEGLSCVEEFILKDMDLLLDHLKGRMIKNVLAVSHLKNNSIMDLRLEYWFEGMAKRGMKGDVIHLKQLSDMRQAGMNYVRNTYGKKKEQLPQSMFCFDHEAAIGIHRGLFELGYTPQRDVFICALADAMELCHLTPNICSLHHPPLKKLIKEVLKDRMGDQGKLAPKMYTPKHKVWAGESR
ncbi:MAG: GntR family transcriptional regulator [Planctomycetes bacterium]|nr:GntR family transcriptional regulator [Planctomycetota bacterium]